METYTSQADQLYQKAEAITHPVQVPPYTSCYGTLQLQCDLYQEAKEMEQEARNIRNLFQEISSSGLPIPSPTMMRKGILSVKHGKAMFSIDQLSAVATAMMEKIPFLFFRPKSDTKEYVILLFWSTSMLDSECEIQKKFAIAKQEIAVDGFRLRFNVENVSAPRRQMLYLVNNYICLKAQKDETFYLPDVSRQQLENFLDLLKEEPPKKRRALDFVYSQSLENLPQCS